MTHRDDIRQLDDRPQEILRLIVRSYIESGEPVGSRTISRTIDRRLSPATIRNVMSELEDAGYLVQPHTSAGRVPSEQGYRFYVDHISDSGRLSKEDERVIQRTLADTDTADELMARASYLLSMISNNVGIVIAPPIAATLLKHIEFVTLGEGKILVVLVSKAGMIQRKLIRVSDQYAQDELDRAGRYLVEKFAGKTLTQIRNELLTMMQEERRQYDNLLSLLKAWRDSLTVEAEPEVIYVQGTSNILSKPEFADVDRLRSLFRMFEEKSRLVQILNECIAAQATEGVNISIGSEFGNPAMRDFTAITSSYVLNESGGFLGIIGPTRMEYERGITVVGYISRLVGEMINA